MVSTRQNRDLYIAENEHLVMNLRDLMGINIYPAANSSLTIIFPTYEELLAIDIINRGCCKPADFYNDDDLDNGSAFLIGETSEGYLITAY